MTVKITEFAEALQEILESDPKYNTRMNIEACKLIVYAVCDTFKRCLADGNDIKLSGFGSFNIVKIKGRAYIHPITGEKHVSADCNAVKFKPGMAIKNAINRRGKK